MCQIASKAQAGFYLEKLGDSTKQRPLKLNRQYHVSTKTNDYERIRLISFTDSSLICSTKGKPREIIQIQVNELDYIDTTPPIIYKVAYMGGVILLMAPVALIASPVVGLSHGWDKAKEGIKFSGMLAGGGLILTSPLLLFRRYEIGKKWKIENNNRH